MQTEQQIADDLKRRIQGGIDPADVRRGLYEKALMWAHEEGVVFVNGYAEAVTSRIWALVEAAS